MSTDSDDDTAEALYAVYEKAQSRAEQAMFESWADRIRAGMALNCEDAGARMDLIDELHANVTKRHPLGVAEQLYEVIGLLHSACEDVNHGKSVADTWAADLLMQLAVDVAAERKKRSTK